MHLDEMRKRLTNVAAEIDWKARVATKLTSRHFRGRDGDVDVRLPDHIFGLTLGRFPVLVTEIHLWPNETMLSELRAVHNQMIIARSYLSSEEVIDAHILFVAVQPPSGVDWRKQIDRIERDEAVCRKLVWLPNVDDLDKSFEDFRGRTFLSEPWALASARRDAALDDNAELVERVLQEKGLSAAAARAWVDIADNYSDDPDAMVERLIGVMETGG
ncbi:ABC-three component system middle component 1 [Paraburkholderia phymatum]|uniref:ABC-three component system middle component 1 n=1 Tax=Paraburkholderia phymatum TaxID=148447 RepID=UPI0031779C40